MIKACETCKIAFVRPQSASGHRNTVHRDDSEHQLIEFAAASDVPADYEVRQPAGGKRTSGTKEAEAPTPGQSQTLLTSTDWSDRVGMVAGILADLAPPLRPATTRSILTGLENEPPETWQSAISFGDFLNDFGLVQSQVRQVLRRLGLRQPASPYGYMSGQGPWAPPHQGISREDFLAGLQSLGESRRAGPDPELSELKTLVIGLIHDRDKGLAVQDAVDRTLAALKPEMDRLRRDRDLAGNGQPFESVANRLIDVVADLGKNLQEGLKPMLQITQASQLHGLGFGAQQISDLLIQRREADRLSNLPVDEKAKAQEVYDRWVKK